MDQKESYCYLILNIYWCHLLNEMSRSLVMTHVVNIWLANSIAALLYLESQHIVNVNWDKL